MVNNLFNGKRNFFFIVIFILLLVSSVYAISGTNIVSEVTSFIVNQQPTISSIDISPTTGSTTTNFACDVTGSDADSDSMTTTYFWNKNGSAPVLVMDFNRNISTNRTGYVPDLSGNNNNGTLGRGNLSEAPTWTSSGKIGGAYEFDGSNDYINIDYDSSFSSSIGSIEFWFKMPFFMFCVTPPCKVQDKTIFDFYKNSNNYLESFMSDKIIFLKLTLSGVTQIDVNYNLSSYSEGDWIHAVWVQRGSSSHPFQVALYIDGSEVELSGTNSGDYWIDDTNFTNLWLGKGTSSFFSKTLDEFRVYDRVLSEQEIKDHHDLKYNTLSYSATSKNENWSCSARVFDGYEYSILNTSTNVTIENTPPDLPILISPTDNNNTLIDRTPNFIWNTTDDDNDTLTFDLQIFNSYVDGHNYTNITATRSGDTYNYTIPDELYTQFEADSHNYTWRVRANDSEEYSNWTDNFTFSIEDYVAVDPVNVNISFGSINPLSTYDTLSGNPDPFLFQNIGNVKVDLYNTTLNPANETFWSSRGLGTEYFQIKADNYSSNSSFNYSGSVTDWSNFSESNSYIVKNLDYHNASNNFVEVDIRLLVPGDEPPTSNSKQIAFHWSAVSD